MNEFFDRAHVQPGHTPDFAALRAAVRALKPRCEDCSVPLSLSETGIRDRQGDAGVERICRACAVSAIGERLLEDLPK